MGRAALFMEDPMWAASVPEDKGQVRKRSLPSHSDCSEIDVDKAASHLMPGGTLGLGFGGYEMRPGQIDMLRAVARAFNSRKHLMVEAGTGVGKSLAYLIPSAIWSYVNDTPVVISTATRNLQSQLVGHDLPRAARAVEACSAYSPDRPFRAAVLKGRSNYLCLHAVEEMNHEGYYALDPSERAEMDAFIDWFHSTGDGDLDSSPFQALRAKLSSSGEDCLGRRCPYRSRCFVMRARQKASEADVVVVNHALALTDAANPGADILPPYGRIVFDEAHNLEDVATDVFSIEFSRKSLESLLSRLVKPGRGARRERGIVGKIERLFRTGAFAEFRRAGDVKEIVLKIRIARAQAIDAGAALLEEARRLFAPMPDAEVIRYRFQDERQYSVSGIFAPYREMEWDEEGFAAKRDAFEATLASLAKLLTDLAEVLAAMKDADGECSNPDLVSQLKAMPDEISSYMLDTAFVLSGEGEDSVFWARRERGKKGGVSLTAAPLTVAEKLEKLFLGAKDSVVMCSATLKVSGRFDYMGGRLGFALTDHSRVDALTAESPFDYFRQTLAMSASFLPDPSAGVEAYSAALAPLLNDIFTRSRGRGLVLFTSYDMMNRVADLARPLFSISGLNLLVQGESHSREAMVSELKSSGGEGTVLFGSQSFWEGVDVPGEALSCVVIARIPFPQVGEPIVEARCDRLKREGESPFWSYFLPEAVIKFRQGFGRLVRTRSDTGVVVVADPRMTTKGYGSYLKKSIPASMHTIDSPDDLLGRISAFLV